MRFPREYSATTSEFRQIGAPVGRSPAPWLWIAVLLPLLIGGCAQMRTKQGMQAAEETRAVVQEVRQCAAAAGVDEAEARAKPAESRTNQEQALLEAIDAENDVDALVNGSEDADPGLTEIQQSLDALIVPQREADAALAEQTAFQAKFRQTAYAFYSHYTELESISDALAEVTGDANEGDMGAGLRPEDRHMIEAIGVVALAPIPVIGPAAALAVWIEDILIGDDKEERLREGEARVVRTMLADLEELYGLLESHGYQESDLSGAISSAQMFLGAIENPDRTLQPALMLSGMTDALVRLSALDTLIAQDVADAQTKVDGIAAATARNFSLQQERSEALNHAQERAEAAQTACLGSPFGDIPAVPGWDTTFWDISSP